MWLTCPVAPLPTPMLMSLGVNELFAVMVAMLPVFVLTVRTPSGKLPVGKTLPLQLLASFQLMLMAPVQAELAARAVSGASANTASDIPKATWHTAHKPLYVFIWHISRVP